MANEKAHPKRAAFLAAFAECGTVTGAAKAADVERTRHYDWLKDEEYAAAFKDAERAATDNLEEVARTRAKAGSDVLLIFLLKGAKPEKYRERYEHTGPNGGPVQVAYKVVEGDCWREA